jgi:membrane fusion protein (multidrug efflux system)
MKDVSKMFLSIMILTLVVSCGKSNKQEAAGDSARKSLEKLKAERAKIDADIEKLQAAIDASNPDAANKARLVDLATVNSISFRHYIDLRGTVDAEDISYISPRLGPGQVKQVLIKQGQQVRKGQLLLKLDDALVRQQVTAATQQLQGIKTQLGLAKTLFERQKNLWDQGIGTEVQLISARTNMESIENQLRSSTEQVKVAQEQLRALNIYSDVDGVADIVNINVGETFTGMTQAGPQIKIVNIKQPKVVISIPENYVAKMKKGIPVEVYIPDADKKFSTTLSLISQSIDPVLRGFIAEAKLPRDASLKPNQVAVVQILDYNAANAVVVPVNTIQTDEAGKYVFVAEKSGTKLLAAKRAVSLGEIYKDSAEVLSGLSAGDQLVILGYQNLYKGQLISARGN